MRVSSRARCSEAKFSLSQGEWASASEDMLALNENTAYPEVSESCRASIPKLIALACEAVQMGLRMP